MGSDSDSGIPEELHYSEQHEWLSLDGDVGTVGITDYAQGELGDIVYVELPQVGATFTKMDVFGTIEAVKAVSELFCPVTGEVVEINESLEDDPNKINQDPYGEGWMVRVRLENPGDLERLLGAADYAQHIGE